MTFPIGVLLTHSCAIAPNCSCLVRYVTAEVRGKVACSVMCPVVGCSTTLPAADLLAADVPRSLVEELGMNQFKVCVTHAPM